MTFAQINQGSGELEVYPDATAGITQEMVKEAQEQEAFIISSIHATEVVYLRLGEMLKDFRDRKLYRARNYDSFRQWADSADLNRLSYQTANNLIRIVEGLKPIFERADLNIEEYPMSTLRAMLPLLGDGFSDDDILVVAQRVRGLTVNDTSAVVKSVRGVDQYPEEVIFKAFVDLMPQEYSYHEFQVICVRKDGTSYPMGMKQRVEKRDYGYLKKLYGRHIDEKAYNS